MQVLLTSKRYFIPKSIVNEYNELSELETKQTLLIKPIIFNKIQHRIYLRLVWRYKNLKSVIVIFNNHITNILQWNSCHHFYKTVPKMLIGINSAVILFIRIIHIIGLNKIIIEQNLIFHVWHMHTCHDPQLLFQIQW